VDSPTHGGRATSGQLGQRFPLLRRDAITMPIQISRAMAADDFT
jgi:hypothetical protein